MGLVSSVSDEGGLRDGSEVRMEDRGHPFSALPTFSAIDRGVNNLFREINQTKKKIRDLALFCLTYSLPGNLDELRREINGLRERMVLWRSEIESLEREIHFLTLLQNDAQRIAQLEDELRMALDGCQLLEKRGHNLAVVVTPFYERMAQLKIEIFIGLEKIDCSLRRNNVCEGCATLINIFRRCQEVRTEIDALLQAEQCSSEGYKLLLYQLEYFKERIVDSASRYAINRSERHFLSKAVEFLKEERFHTAQQTKIEELFAKVRLMEAISGVIDGVSPQEIEAFHQIAISKISLKWVVALGKREDDPYVKMAPSNEDRGSTKLKKQLMNWLAPWVDFESKPLFETCDQLRQGLFDQVIATNRERHELRSGYSSEGEELLIDRYDQESRKEGLQSVGEEIAERERVLRQLFCQLASIRISCKKRQTLECLLVQTTLNFLLLAEERELFQEAISLNHGNVVLHRNFIDRCIAKAQADSFQITHLFKASDSYQMMKRIDREMEKMGPKTLRENIQSDRLHAEIKLKAFVKSFLLLSQWWTIGEAWSSHMLIDMMKDEMRDIDRAKQWIMRILFPLLIDEDLLPHHLCLQAGERADRAMEVKRVLSFLTPAQIKALEEVEDFKEYMVRYEMIKNSGC